MRASVELEARGGMKRSDVARANSGESDDLLPIAARVRHQGCVIRRGPDREISRGISRQAPPQSKLSVVISLSSSQQPFLAHLQQDALPQGPAAARIRDDAL